MTHLLSWLYTRIIFGPRCTTAEPLCLVCRKWTVHDELFNMGRGL